MSNQNKKILFLVFFVAVVVLVRFSPIGTLLTFENLKKHREEFLALVQGHYLQSVAAFIAGYIVFTALSVPGAVILTLAGGFLFGPLWATIYIDIGATTGATFSFLIARYLLGSRLQEKYRNQLSTFNKEMGKNGPRYLLTLRLIPVFPFFLINFLSGLTNVTAETFIWTTALGIIPATIIFAYAGRQVGTINAVSEVLSARVIIALSVLGALALFPAVYNRIKAYKNRSR
jgi:uncharacterized membrane protein YdjX (TVP38/TMEM64 family)